MNSLESSLRHEDRRFLLLNNNTKRWMKLQRSSLRMLHDTDHRTWQQREADQFGSFYPFIISARAESSHITRVAKSQATMRHYARQS
jgi:hypothetical protein